MISVRPETASIGKSEEVEKGYNLITGNVSFGYYIGNAIRYDVEMSGNLVFKVDIQTPWDHRPFSIGEKVFIRFPVETALGIPVT